ncbi:MAG: acyl-CoA dehydrogenase [Candidatus Abyssobacteria bacterium SURF_17]|uniref:Acyl-CoA dehydrogenase n=1 Tax=Candidatus Abyssobacteria bacterium SURF_17 TaxID=2093361 RepID=A0A419F7F3_9BACT|nr:MAG: acyl-CoA dehydrogenase [Candidatus Abyssubacteria bacterium SURF_17]
MGYLELDLNLTDEQKAIRDLSRKFAMQTIRPAGIELDRLADPADVIAKGSALWDVMRKFRALDLHRMAIPKALGGLADENDPLSSVLMTEELSYGDVGVAAALLISNFTFTFAAMCDDEEIQGWATDYCEDTEGKVLGCWAITEPDHGSDWWFGAEPAFTNPKCAPSLRAVRKGDEYILNGQKSAWVSNGTVATHALLNVSLDPSKGMQGTGIALLPLNLSGVSRGKPLNKLGMRALNQGEIIFEDVRIPKNYMVVEDHAMATTMIEATLNYGNMGMGMVFTGLAQAAFDEAVTYAKQRVQGGAPIFEHKNIKLKLFNMFTLVESSRAYLRRIATYNAANVPMGSTLHARSIKVFSTEVALKVASEAVQIFGGNGLSKEYLIEKLFRDARAGTIADGDNEALALVGASHL